MYISPEVIALLIAASIGLFLLTAWRKSFANRKWKGYSSYQPLPTSKIIGEKPAHPIPKTSLTKREQEVARLAAQGLTNKEIAAKLGISHYTVQNHLKKIFGKMGVESRTELSYKLQNGMGLSDLADTLDSG